VRYTYKKAETEVRTKDPTARALALWVVVGCLLAGLSPGLSSRAGDRVRNDEPGISVLYAKTFAKPAHLTIHQRRRVLELSERLAPPDAAVWFALVSGPGCFAGDRVQVFYRPTALNAEIRRGQMADLGLVAELQDDSVERPLGSFAQVPPYGAKFSASLSIPRLNDVPFRLDPALDDRVVVNVVATVREHDRSYRREHLGSVTIDGDKITATTGTTTGSSTKLSCGRDGCLVVGFGMYSGG